jgi:hypothetical protein
MRICIRCFPPFLSTAASDKSIISLDQFPPEILGEIFSHLNKNDQDSISTVCSYFNGVISDNIKCMKNRTLVVKSPFNAEDLPAKNFQYMKIVKQKIDVGFLESLQNIKQLETITITITECQFYTKTIVDLFNRVSALEVRLRSNTFKKKERSNEKINLLECDLVMRPPSVRFERNSIIKLHIRIIDLIHARYLSDVLRCQESLEDLSLEVTTTCINILFSSNNVQAYRTKIRKLSVVGTLNQVSPLFGFVNSLDSTL